MFTMKFSGAPLGGSIGTTNKYYYKNQDIHSFSNSPIVKSTVSDTIRLGMMNVDTVYLGEMVTKHVYSPESFVLAEEITMLLFRSCSETSVAPDSSVTFDSSPLGPSHQKLILIGISI